MMGLFDDLKQRLMATSRKEQARVNAAPQPMDKRLIMYSRSTGCPFVSIARRVLEQHRIPYQEIHIDQDETTRERVVAWTGFLSVPTLVVAEAGTALPYVEPTFLKPGRSPRGIDRGPMITEPGADQLTNWLQKHGFIQGETV